MKLADELVAADALADLQRTHRAQVLLGRAETVDARDGRDHDDVAPAEQRVGRGVPQALDLGVDRGVLLDEGVGLRDVGLGLVVVVVADEVLDRVVRHEVAELVRELRREGLVVRHHQGRALHLLDEPGGRRGLAGSGRAEQHDIRLAGVDAVRELCDRLRLVAARDVVADDLEGADGAGGLHTLQATRRRRQRAGAGIGPELVGLGERLVERAARFDHVVGEGAALFFARPATGCGARLLPATCLAEPPCVRCASPPVPTPPRRRRTRPCRAPREQRHVVDDDRIRVGRARLGEPTLRQFQHRGVGDAVQRRRASPGRRTRWRRARPGRGCRRRRSRRGRTPRRCGQARACPARRPRARSRRRRRRRRRARRAALATTDLPEAIPPVRPTRSILRC